MNRLELFDVTGQAVIVTGAASGLGLAYAEVMAQNGAQVMLLDLDGKKVADQAARLKGMGHQADSLEVDVSNHEAFVAAAAETMKRFGKIDVLFANAGIGSTGTRFSQEGAVDRFDLDLYRRSIDVNLTAPLMCMRAVVPHMKSRKSGAIVATTSIAGMRAEPIAGYGYIASKAAINNIVRQAAVELAPWNIRVNAIAPASFLTSIGGGRMHEPERAKAFIELIPLGRMGVPDEIKGLALLLASRAGSFLTGTVIPIDGGATAGGLPRVPQASQ